MENFGRQPAKLVRLEVRNEAGAILAFWQGSRLTDRIQRPGVSVDDRAKLDPGTFALIWAWIAGGPDIVPSQLIHRIVADRGKDDLAAVEVAPVAVLRNPIVLSPPLRGANWVAANGPSDSSAHRRALIPVNGTARIAQPFVIDWVQARPLTFPELPGQDSFTTMVNRILLDQGATHLCWSCAAFRRPCQSLNREIRLFQLKCSVPHLELRVVNPEHEIESLEKPPGSY